MAFSSPYEQYKAALKSVCTAPSIEQFPKIIVLYGSCDFLISKALRIITNKWLLFNETTSQNVEFNELNPGQFMTTLQQQPLFEGAVLFCVPRIKKMSDATKILENLLTTKLQANRLCLAINDSKVTEKFKKAIKPLNAAAIVCGELKYYDLPKFIVDCAQRFKLRLSQASIRLLSEIMAEDYTTIENEFYKLALVFQNDHKVLEPLDLQTVLGILPHDHVFKLSELLLERKISQAQALLIDLLQRGETALAILGIIARHCHNALHIMNFNRQGFNESQINVKLNLPIPVIRRYTQYIKITSKERLLKTINLCQSVDGLLKSTKISDDVLLSDILLQLT